MKFRQWSQCPILHHVEWVNPNLRPFLAGGFKPFFFPEYMGCHPSQLTFTPSFFRGVGQPPTRYIINHH